MKIIKLNSYLMVWCFCCIVGSVNATTQTDETYRLERHIQALNELTEHRRTSRFFNNEQSPLYGQTIGYTNVGKGNTTLAMRDLVLIHRLPLIFTRVYDSSQVSTGDFGVGWVSGELERKRAAQVPAKWSLRMSDRTPIQG